MYLYGCLPFVEGIGPVPQPLACTFLSAPLLRLPPIQTHNFCSRPVSLPAAERTGPREFHCFYGAGAAPSPWWACPPPLAGALGSPFPAAGAPAPSQQQRASAADRWAPWPEGGSVQAELRWGRVERTRGPRLPLPDVVRRELRRAYGTYPRTDVRVTHRGGEFLLQAAPRVGEPEYRVRRRVLRRPGSSDSGGGGGVAPEAAAHAAPRRGESRAERAAGPGAAR